MEVAGQWRREWAGTAEYGKVTEGGVTRRVARAMEVLHASAPGARVRVMRAAYHSTAGPGAPAASFMLHSSRRVISSGSSFLESPTFMTKVLDSPTYMTKPLEISSLPLESSPERYSEAEDYKVTEPDDLEISEPSKWRGLAPGARPAAAASEDSSSADTASVVDLDSRHNGQNYTNSPRKYSLDSDNSEVQSFKKPASRLSPLLDAPVTLSTLKYKSLLNGTSDNWNDRRKSYSFEDTSPLSETMIHSNDTLAMESSTDSGICKSSEIVNENNEDNNSPKFLKKDNLNSLQGGTFKEWLARNRATSVRIESPLKVYRGDRGSRLEELSEDKITLQSPGKVSITIPMNNKTDDKFQYTKEDANEEADRRTKRVEFCKTELHFAADSGTVNIIATDEKPPPSNDFRRRRSAFVPIIGNFEKPITLFGEKVSEQSDVDNYEISDKNETYDYGSSTKSILKNKIPKPKPYLLGENMMLDLKAENPNSKKEYIIPTTVSLINRQLQPEERKYIGLSAERIQQSVNIAAGIKNYHKSRTINYGHEITDIESEKNKDKNGIEKRSWDNKFSGENMQSSTVKHKLKHLETSPILQAKTRPLRDSDLTFFGVQDTPIKSRGYKPKTRINSLDSESEDFKSVKLIQRVSNSLCNSEAESEDHDYQNISFKHKLSSVPVPTPRKRTTEYFNQSSPEDIPTEITRIIKPVLEEDYQVQETRRSRTTREETSLKSFKNRSISEPPKHKMVELSVLHSPRENRRKEKMHDGSPSPKSRDNITRDVPAICKRTSEDEIPLYANVHTENTIESKHAPVPGRRSRILTDTSKQAIITTSVQNKLVPTVTEERGAGSPSPVTNIRKKHDENRSEKHHRKTQEKIESYSVARTRKISNNNKHSDKPSSRNQSDSIDKRSTLEDKPSTQQVSGDNMSRRHTNERSVDKKRDIISQERNEKKETNKYPTGESTDKGHAKVKRRERSKSKDKAESKDEAELIQTSQIKKKHSERLHNNTKRNEYVINYDDKNGTVSSICKVKSGAAKKNTNSKTKNKENPKESRTNLKTPDKRSLLEYQDQHWIQNGYSHADSKWKNIRRLPVQRTCQIL